MFISIDSFLFSVLVSSSLGHPVIISDNIHMACAVLCVVTQSCPTLGDPTDCGCQAPLSMGLLQARILEWLPCPPPGGLPDPGEIEPGFPALQVDSLPSEPPGKPTHEVVINKLSFR